MNVPARKRRVAISADAQKLFLDTLETGLSVERAAEVSGVRKQRFFERRKQDPVFAEAWEEAYAAGTAFLRDKNLQRATEGYEEVVTDGEGKVIRRTRRVNPADLHFELKRRDPLFRENAQIGIAINSQPSVEARPTLTVEELQAAVQRFKSQLFEAAARGELSSEDAERVGLLSQLEEIGVLGASGVPLMLGPGPAVSGSNDETREAN